MIVVKFIVHNSHISSINQTTNNHVCVRSLSSQNDSLLAHRFVSAH